MKDRLEAVFFYATCIRDAGSGSHCRSTVMSTADPDWPHEVCLLIAGSSDAINFFGKLLRRVK
jgi:hypothetical protein